MNINIKLNENIQDRINKVANEQFTIVIEELLNDDSVLKDLVKDTLKKQVKSVALEIIQSPDLRSSICQKIYPIIYDSLGV